MKTPWEWKTLLISLIYVTHFFSVFSSHFPFLCLTEPGTPRSAAITTIFKVFSKTQLGSDFATSRTVTDAISLLVCSGRIHAWCFTPLSTMYPLQHGAPRVSNQNYWSIQSDTSESILTLSAPKAILRFLQTILISGESARNELSHLKSALFAFWLSE